MPQKVAEIQARHPESELVVAENRDQVLDLIGDADGLFGAPNAMEFAAAEQIRWVQAFSAGVEWLWNVPALQARDDVVVTNMRSAHAATIADHCFGMLLYFTRALPDFKVFHDREEWGRGQVLRQDGGARREDDRHRRVRQHRAGDRAARRRLRDEGAGRRCAPRRARRRRRGGLAARPAGRDVPDAGRAGDLGADHAADARPDQAGPDRDAEAGLVRDGDVARQHRRRAGPDRGAEVGPGRGGRPRRDARGAAAGRRPALEGAELHRHAAHLGQVRR